MTDENNVASDDVFAEFDGPSTETNTDSSGGDTNGGSSHNFSRTFGNSGGRFADELHSVKISAKYRTFFVDLKESNNGKFVKISEKSRGGQKSTIMMDFEDVDQMISALQEMKSKG